MVAASVAMAVTLSSSSFFLFFSFSTMSVLPTLSIALLILSFVHPVKLAFAFPSIEPTSIRFLFDLANLF